MMAFTSADLFQWFIVILGEVSVLLLATNRRVWKTNPAFYVYIGFILARSFLLVHFAFTGSRATYFYAYWRSEAVLSILMLAATLELALAVLRPGRLIPPGACALTVQFSLISTAMVASVGAALTAMDRSELQMYITLQKVGVGIMCALLACTFVFTVLFSIQWKPVFISIGAGLAFLVIVPAFFNTVDAYFPGGHWQRLWFSNSAACGASLLVWMAGLISPVRQGLVSDDQLEQMRDLLHVAVRMRRNLERMVS